MADEKTYDEYLRDRLVAALEPPPRTNTALTSYKFAEMDPQIAMALAAKPQQPIAPQYQPPAQQSAPSVGYNYQGVSSQPMPQVGFLTDKPAPDAPRMFGATLNHGLMGGNVNLRGEYRPNAGLRDAQGRKLNDYTLRAGYTREF